MHQTYVLLMLLSSKTVFQVLQFVSVTELIKLVNYNLHWLNNNVHDVYTVTVILSGFMLSCNFQYFTS